MFERVIVLGAGAAGLGAVWAATARGADVRWLDGGVGASSLAGGAVDDRPWEEIARAAEVLGQQPLAGPLPAVIGDFVRDFELWRLPAEGEPLSRLATEAGCVRLARGHDRALLDLARVSPGARVLLPRLPRPEWDADSLARALSCDPFAESRRLRFEAIDATLLKFVDEERIAAADFAARHDDDERRGWFCDRLREALARAGRADALLVGPWLGAADIDVAQDLKRRLTLVVGEVLGNVGSAAGLRFESARTRLCQKLGARIERVHARRVARRGDEFAVWLDDDKPALCDAVVIAVGGVAAGGVIYEPPEQRSGQDIASAGGVPFRLSLKAPVRLRVAGKLLDVVSSMHGPTLDEVAWPTDADPSHLEAVGIACEGVEIERGLYAAGDAIADRPRTLLQAVYSGALAGAAAAGEPGQVGLSSA
ncbi:MAG TPA: hypothetical protein VFB62_24435 [Polyangiaceae bacterium]|jgi:glycerol-3-phosphate dehydrogenase subunit B|nr:hypothetical protein [Polyangiaceae bacterium]